jgi:integrase
MTTRRTETVTGVPGLYVLRGKRKNTYFARLAGQYTPLGGDEEAAKRKLRELLELPPDDNSIQSMCERYLAEQWALLRARDPVALAEGTLIDYEHCLRKHIIPVFGHMQPQDFKPTHGAQYLDRRRKGLNGRKPAPVRGNREMAALGSAFNYGLRAGLVDENPCRSIRRNKERPRQRRVTIAELNAFLAHAQEKGGSAYLVALIGCCVALSGRRRAEVLGLVKSALSEDGIRVKDAKTKAGEAHRYYKIAWSPILRQLVEEAAAIPRRVSSIYLFATLDGQTYTDQGFKCLWNRLMHSFAPEGAASPKWFRAHDLRALYVSEMLEQGRAPNTHANEETMRRVYDRRREINVTPLA